MPIYRLITKFPSFIGFSSYKSHIIHNNIIDPKLKTFQLMHQRIIYEIFFFVEHMIKFHMKLQQLLWCIKE